ncbi:hypothetical protein TNCT_564102, partial [Trichonephila clavata]
IEVHQDEKEYYSHNAGQKHRRKNLHPQSHKIKDEKVHYSHNTGQTNPRSDLHPQNYETKEIDVLPDEKEYYSQNTGQTNPRSDLHPQNYKTKGLTYPRSDLHPQNHKTNDIDVLSEEKEYYSHNTGQTDLRNDVHPQNYKTKDIDVIPDERKYYSHNTGQTYPRKDLHPHNYKTKDIDVLPDEREYYSHNTGQTDPRSDLHPQKYKNKGSEGLQAYNTDKLEDYSVSNRRSNLKESGYRSNYGEQNSDEVPSFYPDEVNFYSENTRNTHKKTNQYMPSYGEHARNWSYESNGKGQYRRFKREIDSHRRETYENMLSHQWPFGSEILRNLKEINMNDFKKINISDHKEPFLICAFNSQECPPYKIPSCFQMKDPSLNYGCESSDSSDSLEDYLSNSTTLDKRTVNCFTEMHRKCSPMDITCTIGYGNYIMKNIKITGRDQIVLPLESNKVRSNGNSLQHQFSSNYEDKERIPRHVKQQTDPNSNLLIGLKRKSPLNMRLRNASYKTFWYPEPFELNRREPISRFKNGIKHFATYVRKKRSTVLKDSKMFPTMNQRFRNAELARKLMTRSVSNREDLQYRYIIGGAGRSKSNPRTKGMKYGGFRGPETTTITEETTTETSEATETTTEGSEAEYVDSYEESNEGSEEISTGNEVSTDEDKEESSEGSTETTNTKEEASSDMEESMEENTEETTAESEKVMDESIEISEQDAESLETDVSVSEQGLFVRTMQFFSCLFEALLSLKTKMLL